MYNFKIHIFENHRDYEVIPRYGFNVERLLSPFFLEARRKLVLCRLAANKFDSFIIKLINREKEITELPYRTVYPLNEDEVDEQMPIRLEAYHKKITIFHNLAAQIEG